jgi:hypothetical protein
MIALIFFARSLGPVGDKTDRHSVYYYRKAFSATLAERAFFVSEAMEKKVKKRSSGGRAGCRGGAGERGRKRLEVAILKCKKFLRNSLGPLGKFHLLVYSECSIGPIRRRIRTRCRRRKKCQRYQAGSADADFRRLRSFHREPLTFFGGSRASCIREGCQDGARPDWPPTFRGLYAGADASLSWTAPRTRSAWPGWNVVCLATSGGCPASRDGRAAGG